VWTKNFKTPGEEDDVEMTDSGEGSEALIVALNSLISEASKNENQGIE
jgi:hypothetical protein